MKKFYNRKNRNADQKAYSLAKIYMGTSDDLLFWVLIDTLFLSVVKGLSTEQISVVFSASFWALLLLRYPCYLLLRRLDIASSVVTGSVIFLASSVLLTFGNSMPLFIAGQCLYLIAPTFIDMGDVILKELSAASELKEDLVQAKAFTGFLYGIITLITALLINPLMKLDPRLPMLLCVLARVIALLIAVRIKKARPWAQEKKEVSVKNIVRKIPRSTVSYLIMVVAIGVFFSISGKNIKLLFQNILSDAYPESDMVRIFSWALIGTRIAKIVGSGAVSLIRRESKNYEAIAVLAAGFLFLPPALGIFACLTMGTAAVALACSSLILNYLLFNVMSILRSQLLLDRLNQSQIVSVLFVRDTSVTILAALASTLITLMIVRRGMLSVMVILAIIVAVIFFTAISGRFWKQEQRNRYELQWGKAGIDGVDSIMTSVLILLSQYGFVRTFLTNPRKLSEKITSVENIDRFCPRFRYVGKTEYRFETLLKKYTDGYPCAIKADDGGGYRWYPVLYADSDGAVIYNCYGDKNFVSDFQNVTELCCFKIVRPSDRNCRRSESDIGSSK